jgi:hypothetical protein
MMAMSLKQINEDSTVEDTKYIVFKRHEFYELMGKLQLPPGNENFSSDEDCAPLAKRILDECEGTALQDATVIRGQDLFAANALDVYANSIGITMQVMDNRTKREALSKVADYFHQRAQQAHMIGYKLPDGDE